MNNFLTDAKNAKNDEFYTRLCDVEREIYAYHDYSPATFKNKTILLPCDDPEWSAFTLFFVQKFDEFGLRKLISTSYCPGKQGKVITLKRDNRRKVTRIDNITCEYLSGDGDFRSPEVKTLRDEADIIITNPPFSLFREFIEWVNPCEKSYLTIANKNAITLKSIFPLLQSNLMWVGNRSMSSDMYFGAPAGYDPSGKPASRHRVINGELLLRSPSIWLTNMPHGKRLSAPSFMTMQENIKFNSRVNSKSAYVPYDNYDAIEVPAANAVPCDYQGAMGVPISFLDLHCPSQYEIVGITENGDTSPIVPLRKPGCDKYDRPYLKGQRLYSRIIIRPTSIAA